MTRRWPSFAVFLGLWALALAAQWQSGAYRTELSGISDQPAHMVTAPTAGLNSFTWR